MARLKTPSAENLASHVAREIRAEMGRRGMTQEALAERLGWSQRALSRRLTGDVVIDTAELEEMAAAFGLPLEAFLPAPARTP